MHVKIHVLGWHPDELGKPARINARGTELLAQGVATADAQLAFEARHVVVHEYPVAYLEWGALPYLHHVADGLMTKHHRCLSVLVPLHEVRAADSARPGADDDLTRTSRRLGVIVDRETSRPVVDRCLHAGDATHAGAAR